MEEKLLDMKNISKTFGSVQALKGVSLDLYAGEVLALMGENGAGKKVVVIEGVNGSPISSKRLKGFQEAVSGSIPREEITYHYGEWLRDVAELRMKDYLVVNDKVDIIFAFNDEMAYGAYLACQQLRVRDSISFIGVDGFEGEIAGRNLVEKGILNATIQSPDFGALAYDTALEILRGNEVERDITVVSRVIS